MTDLDNGLTSLEVKKRLQEHGANELEAKREYSVVKLLVGQFMSPLIYVLGVAGVATICLREWVDAAVILSVVVVNSMLGFWQEFKAAKSLAALKSYLKPKTKVIRDGKRVAVPMVSLVPGDIVLLDHGESVAADGIVVEAEELSVNEAMLTGESVPREKLPYFGGQASEHQGLEAAMQGPEARQAHHYVYMGTLVSGGFGKMMVIATGQKTQMGQIAHSLAVTEEEDTPLQQRLNGLARTLMLVVVVTTAAIFGLGLLRGGGLLEMFETAIALAVAAIPEGLVVSMTVILALGMQRILKKKALVRKLVAAETLGSVSVICCDKTGTLTEGKMKVVDYVGDRDELIRGAIFANNQRDEEGMAMYEWVKGELFKKKVDWTGSTSVGQIRQFYRRVDGVAFSSVSKYAASLNQSKSRRLVAVVGAPEVVMRMCYMSASRKREEMAKIQKMAASGHRLIAVASKSTQQQKITPGSLKQLGWHGVLVFEDPIRQNVRGALEAALAAGVKVKVITGDYRETAEAVLERVMGEGFVQSENQVMTGEELRGLSARQLRGRIGEVVLFARTTPDQKLRIVEALKSKGEVVAMTGDGVNDAPALKAADIGVVVNEASDVSKQTADLVLLDSNFQTIVAAIGEGRAIYQSMRRVVAYLLGSAFQELVLIGGSMVLGLPLPLSAVQILWINLAVDGFPGVALAFDGVDSDSLDAKPINRKAMIVDGEMGSLIVVLGLVTNVMLLAIYAILYKAGVDFERLRSFIFVAVGVNSLLYIFSIKSLRKNLWQIALFDNKYLLLAVGAGLGLMVAAVSNKWLLVFLGNRTIDLVQWGGVLVISGVTIAMVELTKFISIKRKQGRRGEQQK